MQPSRAEDYDALRLQVIRERWDQKADRWDADLADPCLPPATRTTPTAASSTRPTAVVAARQSFCRDRLLVDLACGTGLVLAHFADRFDRAVGIDISPRMLAAAAARRMPRVELLEASCFELADPARVPHRLGRGRALARHPALALWPSLGRAAA